MGTENSNRRFLNGPHIKILLPFILLSKNMLPVQIDSSIYLTFEGNFFPKKVGKIFFVTNNSKIFKNKMKNN
jgi:hypothetical protein